MAVARPSRLLLLLLVCLLGLVGTARADNEALVFTRQSGWIIGRDAGPGGAGWVGVVLFGEGEESVSAPLEFRDAVVPNETTDGGPKKEGWFKTRRSGNEQWMYRASWLGSEVSLSSFSLIVLSAPLLWS